MWTLSDESKHPVHAPEGRKFVHLSFSGIGIELAAVDSAGIVHVYSLQGPLNRMIPAYEGIPRATGPQTESDVVVGMHWLPLWSAEFRVSPHMCKRFDVVTDLDLRVPLWM